MVTDGTDIFGQNKIANGSTNLYWNWVQACIFNPNLFQRFQIVHECLGNSVPGICSSG